LGHTLLHTFDKLLFGDSARGIPHSLGHAIKHHLLARVGYLGSAD
jgi:hypothetical protein